MIKFISQKMAYQMRVTYSMGFISDRIDKRSSKRQIENFKRQLQSLANKPAFTLLDFKQRVDDEYQKIKNNPRSKLSNEMQQAQKKLLVQKKILNCMFEEQLIMEKPIKMSQKEQIALVTQIELDEVSKTFQKYEEYKSMHRLLRQLKLNNEPLPDTLEQLNQMILVSGLSSNSKKLKYIKYMQYRKIYQNRMLKKYHNHGYFFD